MDLLVFTPRERFYARVVRRRVRLDTVVRARDARATSETIGRAGTAALTSRAGSTAARRAALSAGAARRSSGSADCCVTFLETPFFRRTRQPDQTKRAQAK
jgi:hypothetical protein